MRILARLALGAAVGLALVGYAHVSADQRRDPTTGVHSGSGVEWNALSQHSGEHPGTCAGTDSAYASHHPQPESEHVPSVSGGVQEYVLKKRGRLYYATPFTGIQRTSSEHTSTYMGGGGGDNPGWIAFMSTRKSWNKTFITGSDGRISVWYGDENTVSEITIAAHTLVEPPEMSVPVSQPESAPSLVADFYDNGVPQFDENGDIVYDQNGNVQYDVPPAVVARFTSSMVVAGSTTTYTYLLENFENESRTFSIPQVTTTQYPNGWAGTLAGNGTASTDVSVSGPAHAQYCQIDLEEMLRGGTYALPSKMYVPESRLTYDGSVELNSVTYNPSLGNVVSATQSGDVATKAVLWRIDGDGNHVLIAEEEGLWGPAAGITLVDPDPAEGTNTYYVMTGVEPNGYASETAAIVN